MKINIKATEKISAAIKEAEGQARCQLLDPAAIAPAVERAEQKLAALDIPKKYWEGYCVLFSPEQVARSYKEKAYGTYAEVTRFKNGWFLTHVRRKRVSSRPYGAPSTRSLYLSDAAYTNLPRIYEL
jgi:hypothetical protein